jgi:uncharacterized protein (TIGR02453 family)
MAFEGFSAGTLEFMSDLAEHNDRDWFAQNRARYDAELLDRQKAFVEAIAPELEAMDPRIQAVPAVNKSIFRINRDIRFSRDKSPYKTHSDLFFWLAIPTAEKKNSPGYFMRIAPGQIWVGCGAHSLVPEQLARLRAAIVAPESGIEFEGLLADLEADDYRIGERGLARVPAGFSKDAPRADLLRLTAVHAIREYAKPPKEFTSAKFIGWCMTHFERTKPLVDWLGEHL